MINLRLQVIGLNEEQELDNTEYIINSNVYLGEGKPGALLLIGSEKSSCNIDERVTF
jgi:hypothetical protein